MACLSGLVSTTLDTTQGLRVAHSDLLPGKLSLYRVTSCGRCPHTALEALLVHNEQLWIVHMGHLLARGVNVVPRRRHRKRHATEAFGHAHGRPSSSITGAAFNFSENLAFGDCYISDTRASPSPSSSAVVHSIDTREAALAERERNLQRLENQALTQQEILRDTELVLAGREAELEDRERFLDQTSMVSAGQVLLDQIEEHYTCPLCPLCRSLAVDPAPDPPRRNTLCPFIPNRLVDNVVNNMVEKLEGVVEKTAVEVDKHDAAYMHERSKAKDAPPALSSGLSEWGKSGQKRSDWTEKAAILLLLLAELKIYPQTWSHGDGACCRPLG
ncbi:uncharacterized protein STEHIDRAFT_111295 [Stereum hirsutum FP-91666 SS1]|uniref:uncharacterized protein n=1 Tax=Stereum hirsutum (strain FP-91666) TaxID=721885 RepID=UPI000444A469|nr:uncharacterized protein STEHIDRAFT_111295 [Stereum hirsutum FP-91666 SS1]EIM86890.1 hypothetical protein STEHIDRAFT_111295 [Stereum hirsutum FP-91666 SS1]